MLEWQTGKVIEIIDETPNTRRFFIETPSKENFIFLPGQFVTLDLPIHEKKSKRLRSYSIASPPNESNIFELVIVLVEEGAGTNYLFNNINLGDELTFRGPAGVFTLPRNLENDYYMICTGTGIAPFRSMLQYIYQQQIPSKHIHLIYGTRTKQDLLYYKEMSELDKIMPNFFYHPILSRENWEGQTGYVHDVYKQLLIDKKREAHFLLCGWKNMIDETRQNLAEMGFNKSQIHYELYG
jgi:CDP-4-dehydro-6-deoxyglucose reductase